MIRPATLDDIDGLKAAVIAAYAPYVDQGLGLPAVADGLDDDIRDNHVWVADDRGLILGGIVLMLHDGSAHVSNLAVHPLGKGQGLGRQLMDTAARAAQAAGHAQIVLTTHQDMAGTRAFYKRLGWVETGQDGTKIYLSLALTPEEFS